MERDKRKKSKMPCLFGGNGENLNRKSVQPTSPSDGIFRQDLFMLEVGQTSCKQAYGTPMKTLLAKEMSNETSAKKRSPNLIAKLMGLDGLPSPQPIHRQQKKASDHPHKSTVLLGGKRSEKRFSHQSDKKNTIEQQQFKDVYEDPEASHVTNQHYSSPMSANRRSTKEELGYIQERCDEMLRESIAIKNKLKRVDSNPDLMLSFLQKPDSLFVKRLHDQQRMPSSPPCNQITLLKSSAVRNGAYAKSMKDEKGTVTRRAPVSHQIIEDRLLDYSSRGGNNSYRSSRVQLERKEATAISPTRIVLLKPNVAKLYTDNDTVCSPDEHIKNTESEWYSCGKGQGASEMYKGTLREIRSYRHKSREAREIARKITSQMKEGFESGHASVLDYGFGGYAGDESLYNMSASASISESEMMAVPSRKSFNRSDRPRHSSSNISESSVIREAKKRMSQRWQTHSYKDAGMVGRGSTLEEMLSIPNGEVMHGRTGCVVGLVADNDGYISPAESGRTLCISNQTHTMSDCHEVQGDEKIVVHNEAPVHRGNSKGAKENFNGKGDLHSKDLRYHKRRQSSEKFDHCGPESDCSLQESHPSQKQTETCSQNRNLAEQVAMSSDFHGDFTNAPPSAVDIIRMSSKSSNELTPALATCMLGDIDSSAVDEGGLNSQEASTAKSGGTVSVQLSGPEPEYSEGSKEVDQHVPSTEDASSDSDCFERVSSQLHELRKQLHLLKMESGSTYDSPNDEEVDSVSINWESAYLSDLLQGSGFYDHDPHTFMTTWYSVECPIDPRLFDNLEKKYSGVSRSERRLLFDRVNEALLAVSKTALWVSSGIQMSLTEMGFEDQLQKVLGKQERESMEEFEEMSIDKDSDWFEPLNEIDVVGKGITELLVDELVVEIVRV